MIAHRCYRRGNLASGPKSIRTTWGMVKGSRGPELMPGRKDCSCQVWGEGNSKPRRPLAGPLQTAVTEAIARESLGWDYAGNAVVFEF